MSPTQPPPDSDEAKAAQLQVGRLLRTLSRQEAAAEATRAEADRLVYLMSRMGYSLGALAQALGLSRPGVQKMVRRGKMREEAK